MFFPVHRADLPVEEAQGQGEGVEIAGQGGCHEGEGDVDVGVLKIVNAAGGGDFEANLGKSGSVVGIGAHEAEDLAIHPDEADQGVLAAGPMLGGPVVQMVGG